MVSTRSTVTGRAAATDEHDLAGKAGIILGSLHCFFLFETTE
jgi:hypothetical protein